MSTEGYANFAGVVLRVVLRKLVYGHEPGNSATESSQGQTETAARARRRVARTARRRAAPRTADGGAGRRSRATARGGGAATNVQNNFDPSNAAENLRKNLSGDIE